jgi:hypothetical protein
MREYAHSMVLASVIEKALNKYEEEAKTHDQKSHRET